MNARGYIERRVPGHPRARRGARVFEHILVVEAALGRHLLHPAVVHHIDGNKGNNVRANLVACQDQTYHMLLHRRERALEATGDADKVQCRYCQEWGLPGAFDGNRARGQFFHLSCASAWQQQLRDAERAGRPKHLEAVAARPHCKHGHPWTAENTRINARGARWCLACSRDADRRRKERTQ